MSPFGNEKVSCFTFGLIVFVESNVSGTKPDDGNVDLLLKPIS